MILIGRGLDQKKETSLRTLEIIKRREQRESKSGWLTLGEPMAKFRYIGVGVYYDCSLYSFERIMKQEIWGLL